MIEAQLQGRRLVVTVTDEGEPVCAPFSIVPVSAKTGRQLSAHYLLVVEKAPGYEEVDLAADFYTAFGPENMERADEELSKDEGELVAQAAFLWQTVGGIDAVRALLEAHEDGTQGGAESAGKALRVFRARMVPFLSQISRRTESAHPTPEAATPGTGTRRGGGSSGSKPRSPRSGAAKGSANSTRRAG